MLIMLPIAAVALHPWLAITGVSDCTVLFINAVERSMLPDLLLVFCLILCSDGPVLGFIIPHAIMEFLILLRIIIITKLYLMYL